MSVRLWLPAESPVMRSRCGVDMPSRYWELFVPSDEPVQTQVLRVGFLLAHWLKSLPTAVGAFGTGALVTTRGTGLDDLAAGLADCESGLVLVEAWSGGGGGGGGNLKAGPTGTRARTPVRIKGASRNPRATSLVMPADLLVYAPRHPGPMRENAPQTFGVWTKYSGWERNPPRILPILCVLGNAFEGQGHEYGLGFPAPVLQDSPDDPPGAFARVLRCQPWARRAKARTGSGRRSGLQASRRPVRRRRRSRPELSRGCSGASPGRGERRRGQDQAGGRGSRRADGRCAAGADPARSFREGAPVPALVAASEVSRSNRGRRRAPRERRRGPDPAGRPPS